MPHSSNTLSLSAKKHIDEVCLRFESAWQQVPRPALEHYLENVTEPEFSSLLCELLLLDLDYRLHAGETPDADAYHECFPGHGRIVQSVFRQCGLPCARGGDCASATSATTSSLKRSRAAGWEWFTRPGRSASIAWWL